MYRPKHALLSLLRLARRSEAEELPLDLLRERARASAPIAGSERGRVLALLTGLAERRFSTRPRRALSVARVAYAFSDLAPDQSARDAAVFTYGLTRLQHGANEEALAIFEKLLRRCEVDPDPALKAAVYGNIASALHALGEIDRSLALYKSSLAVSRAIGDRDGEGADLCNLANVYASIGDVEQALSLYRQALEIARQTGNHRHESNHLGNLGVLLLDTGDVAGAVSCHERALSISRENRDRRSEAQDLGNLGSAVAVLGELHRGLVLIDEGRALAERIGDPPSLAMLDTRCAEVLHSLGRIEEALGRAQSALEVARASREPRAIASRLAVRARIDADADPAGGREIVTQLETACALAERLRERRTEALARAWLAHVKLASGDAGGAEAVARRALETSRQVGDKRGEGTSLGILGSAVAADGRVDEGLRFLGEGSALLEQVRDAPGATTLMLMTGQVELKGRPELAEGAARRAAEQAARLGMRLVEARSRLCRARALAATGDDRGARGEAVAARDRFCELGRADDAAACAAIAGLDGGGSAGRAAP